MKLRAKHHLLLDAASSTTMSSRSAARLLSRSIRGSVGSQLAGASRLAPALPQLATPASAPHTHQALLPLQHLSHSFSTTPHRAATTDPSKSSPPAPTEKPVSLIYELHSPPKDASPNAGGAQSLVVCHGLFGSKQNWRSLAKAMAKQFGVPVYAVDLRNHGTSTEHVEGMSYRDMALDLLGFVKEHNLEKIALVGHSMGGKAVMAFALSPELKPGTLEYLISVDMSPARGPLSKEFEEYIEAMLAIEKKGCRTRGEADELLKETEPDVGVRQFLLTNLQKPESSESWSFRIPVSLIKRYMSQIGDFPYDASDRTWDGKTLFVKGTKSKYINRRNKPLCNEYFPNAAHVDVEAGHWVQAEKPREFIQALSDFFAGKL